MDVKKVVARGSTEFANPREKEKPPDMQTEFHRTKINYTPWVFIRRWLPAAVAALFLCNCLASKPPGDRKAHHLSIETLWGGSQCGCVAPQARVRWVTGPDQLSAAMAAAESSALRIQMAHLSMDWKHNGLIWIDMGLKPTGGYALSLAAPSARISSGVVVITVRWRQPRPGSIVTQQLTSPCLILKLAQENFHIIEIKDESGRVHARVEANHE
jgi:hypothetical protein